MTILTPKQENFILAYLKTGNASEAYRRAYDADKMLPTTINRKAKELLDNGKIAARINELRKPAIKRAQITLESHLEEMERLKGIALQSDNINAALAAEMGRAKAAGLYVTKTENKTEISGPSGEPVKMVIDAAISNLAMRIRAKDL